MGTTKTTTSMLATMDTSTTSLMAHGTGTFGPGTARMPPGPKMVTTTRTTSILSTTTGAMLSILIKKSKNILMTLWMTMTLVTHTITISIVTGTSAMTTFFIGIILVMTAGNSFTLLCSLDAILV